MFTITLPTGTTCQYHDGTDYRADPFPYTSARVRSVHYDGRALWAYLPDDRKLHIDHVSRADVARYLGVDVARRVLAQTPKHGTRSHYTRLSSGAEMFVNRRGRCEDAPCCGCCS